MRFISSKSLVFMMALAGCSQQNQQAQRPTAPGASSWNTTLPSAPTNSFNMPQAQTTPQQIIRKSALECTATAFSDTTEDKKIIACALFPNQGIPTDCEIASFKDNQRIDTETLTYVEKDRVKAIFKGASSGREVYLKISEIKKGWIGVIESTSKKGKRGYYCGAKADDAQWLGTRPTVKGCALDLSGVWTSSGQNFSFVKKQPQETTPSVEPPAQTPPAPITSYQALQIVDTNSMSGEQTETIEFEAAYNKETNELVFTTSEKKHKYLVLGCFSNRSVFDAVLCNNDACSDYADPIRFNKVKRAN